MATLEKIYLHHILMVMICHTNTITSCFKTLKERVIKWKQNTS